MQVIEAGKPQYLLSGLPSQQLPKVENVVTNKVKVRFLLWFFTDNYVDGSCKFRR